MGDVPFLLALAAGVLAAVNPCGFALLPAYLSLLVVGDAGPSRPGRGTAVGRALVLTAAMTAGFVAVFGAFGLAVAPVATWVQDRLPWFTIGFGVLLVALGGWLLAGRQLPTLRLKPGRAPALTRSVPSMALFGVAYALASLSCTIGPFLAIVVSSLRSGSTMDGVALFLAYAAGMGLVVGATALAVALLRTSLIRGLRRAGPAISRAGGALLLLAGGYVAYYGWYEVRLAKDGPAAFDDPVVTTGGRVQQWLAHGLDQLGVSTVVIAFAVLLAIGLVWGRLTRVGRSGRLDALEQPREPSGTGVTRAV
jgi:cytochrome c biogenesis protein CcdA